MTKLKTLVEMEDTQMDKEKKEKRLLTKGKIITLSILLAITITIFALSQYIYGETSVFNQTISANTFISTCYNKIPALLKSIQIFTISWLLSISIRLLLKKLLKKTEIFLKKGLT